MEILFLFFILISLLHAFFRMCYHDPISMGRAFYKHKLFLFASLFLFGLAIVGSVLFFSRPTAVYAQQGGGSDLSVGGFASSFWEDLTSGQVADDLATGVTHPGDTAASVRNVVTNLANGQSATDAVVNAGNQLEADVAQSNELFPCDTTDIICQITRMIMQIITGLLGLVVTFLGWLVTFAIKILIGFAKYNGFASAAPVVMGWVVVRDVVNMFFIVILLVSAFATIIGYDSSFHYTKVLPKLLLMAVLINFSKTLIMLLVDLSQVIMLTFVNAFQQASGANFIRAFKLDKITQLATCNEAQRPLIPTPGGNPEAAMAATAASTSTGASVVNAASTTRQVVQGTASELSRTGCGTNTAIGVTNIILAYLLGIVLLIIALGVIIIMIAYIIARIVGLWIVLIFSPIAFFATALPSRLQKGLDNFTGKYWSRMSALLTGGPVIAFFLWLTLATMQGSLRTLPSNNVPRTEESGGGTFISGVGNSQELATFIVAIAMLLMGLDAAVNAAQGVSETVGKFAGDVRGLTTNAAKFAALSPLYMGRSGARAVDRRYDITGKASRLGLKVLPQTDYTRRVLTKGAVMRRKEKEEAMAQEQLADMKNMTRDEKIALANSYGSSGIGRSPDENLARAKIYEDLGSDDSRFKHTKARAAKIEEELKSDSRYKGVAADEIKRMANARAIQEATKEGGAHLAEAKKSYIAQGETGKAGDIDKLIEKNPALEQDPKKFNSLMQKIKLDPDKIKGLSAEALSDPTVAMALLPAGAIRSSGGKITGFDASQFESFKEQNKDNKALVSNLDALATHIDNTPGGVNMEDFGNVVMQRDNQGRVQMYNGKSGERMMSGNERTARASLESDIVNAPNQGRLMPGVLDPAGLRAVGNSLDAGVPIAETMRIGGEASDGAVSRGMGERAGAAFAAARNVTTKPDLDVALSSSGVASGIAQLESTGVTTSAQIRIISGIHNGGAGAKAIAQNWERADKDQRRMFEQVVKVATSRAADIGKKRSAGGVITAEELSVEAFVADLKRRMPPKTTRDATGAIIPLKDAAGHDVHDLDGDLIRPNGAPAAIAKYLH